MNRRSGLRARLSFGSALFFFVVRSLHPQGSLAPPGAPAGSMKSLAEIEPRINIQRAVNPLPNDANYHYIISQPGSYYLSGNLFATKPNLIHVTVPGVTIDMNGFQLSRATGSGGEGITIDAAADLCVVRNGTIAGFAHGVNCASQNSSFAKLTFTGCSEAGLEAGYAANIEDCHAYNNSGNGIAAAYGSGIKGVVAWGNQAYGIYTTEDCMLVECVSRFNSGASGFSGGIRIGSGSTVIGCVASGNFTTSSSASETTGSGIDAGSGSVVVHCTVSGNTGAGILLNDGAEAIGCNVTLNGSPPGLAPGIRGFNRVTVKDCSVTRNYNSGIVVSGDSFVIGNHVSYNGQGNGGAGIDTTAAPAGGSRVEGNQVRDNKGIGIHTGSSDIVIRNSSAANNNGSSTVDYLPNSGSNFAPIQSPASATNPIANMEP